MTEQRLEARRAQGGFALILAILSLLVLTFLGLTLAATTSTELQIATNYRWGLQANFNAEAGIEVAKIYLRAVPVDWATVLPVARVGLDWDPNAGAISQPVLPSGYVTGASVTRDWENTACDNYGGHTGYGIVLTSAGIGTPPSGPAYLQDVGNVLGQPLNGSFTVWIRRSLTQSPTTGRVSDDALNSVAILTSEGVAPRVGLPNAARRVIELKVQGASFDCQSQTAMGGSGQGGGGFASCRSTGAGCAAAAQVAKTFGAAARSTDNAKNYSTQAVGSLCDTGKN